MSIYETKKNAFLGKAPTHIQQEDLLDFFLYTYEFIWTASAYVQYENKIKEHFETLLNELKNKSSQLTQSQEWWALVLFALKDLAQAENYSFSVETIQFLLNRIHTLSDEELEDYCNSINHAFYSEMPDVMSIRPFEVQRLHSDAYENDHILKYFLDRQEDLLSIFKDNLEEKEIEKMYINNLMLNDKEIDYKFTDFWNSYLEIFIGFSISMFGLVLQSPKKSMEEIEETLRQSNLVFLIASVKNNAKFDKINLKLFDVIKPLYVEHLELNFQGDK